MPKPPNILFLFPDQHRPDWLGDNPDLPLRTPHIDALAGRGVTFDRTYSPSPVCAPARACLASGRDYPRCGVPGNHTNYPLDQPTYYQSLRDAGYRVAGVGKFDLHKDTSDFAKLDWHLDGSRNLEEWGFTDGIDNEGKMDGTLSYRAAGEVRGPYTHFLQQRGLLEQYIKEHEEAGKFRGAYITELPDDAYCDNWLSQNGIDILRDLPRDQPWHMQVNFTGPHAPMDVTASMAEAWQDAEIPPPHDHPDPDEHTMRSRRYYAAMIENIDRQVGRFIDVVRQRGELDNTIIVFASDHGEMLGDHGRWGKSVHHEPSARVPMIIAGPGVREGVRTNTLTHLHDLAATFLDAAGCDPLPKMEAKSLLPLLRGETQEHREHAFTALQQWRAVVGPRYKFVINEGEQILHDLELDPWEDENRADDPALAAVRNELRDRLNAWWDGA